MGDKRSPNYPAVGLGKAVEDVRSWWAQEKRSPVAAEVGVKAWGYKMLSGPARTRISALKKYGFLEETPNGFKLSDRGVAVSIHKPEERDYQDAIRAAAMEPDLFRELLDTHADASEQAITNHLIMKRGFVPLGAKQAAKAFKDTIAVAKLQDSSYASRGGNGAGKPELALGDTVQWESQGMLQFDVPRKITGFSDDGTIAFVEGTGTGIPVQQLQKVDAAPSGGPSPSTFSTMPGSTAKTSVSSVFPLPGGNRVQVMLDRKVTAKE
ncbi:MAG: hypothetical protein HYY13_02125, partial [Nitrospirae bacterium]|nr:hypothetical protein [Nitrospirota bacterium]